MKNFWSSALIGIGLGLLLGGATVQANSGRDSSLRASVIEVEGARFVCFSYREGIGGSAVNCHRLPVDEN